MIEHERWLNAAAHQAARAECLQAKCGAVIVSANSQLLIGFGFNGPPANRINLRCRCGRTAPSPSHPKSDRTCCVHAEWRAILEAGHHPRLRGSGLYFTRVNGQGHRLPSGHPYCTVCSRLALEVGIGFWVLEHADGIRIYSALEYDDVSHREPPPPTTIPSAPGESSRRTT